MSLSSRLNRVLKEARISPRHLGGAIKIHFVTIYRTLNNDGSRQPIHEQILTDAVDKLEAFISEGKLPFDASVSRKEKTDRLKDLFDNHD